MGPDVRSWRRSTSAFQSTHPVWDGTAGNTLSITQTRFQSTHPVWDGTRLSYFPRRSASISIHPSRVGWDNGNAEVAPDDQPFQSTHPVWDGTETFVSKGTIKRISIHPSRVGWDRCYRHHRRKSNHFNPPIPCGMGPSRRHRRADPSYFNPPIPCGMGRREIGATSASGHFNPPIPCGMGRKPAQPRKREVDISIHPSRVGWDSKTRSMIVYGIDFNPPIPCGMGLKLRIYPSRKQKFQSTHPVWDGTVC